MKSFWYTRRFMGMISAPARTRILRVGIHVGLFEALREPKSAEDVARELDLAPDLVAAWCRAAEASRLLRRRGDGWESSGFALFLVESPLAESYYAILDQAVETTSPLFDKLPGLMHGAPRPVFGDPAAARRAAAGSSVLEDRALAALGRIPGVRDARRILDVGCGYGTYLISLLRQYRDARGVGVELESDLVEEARRRFEAAGVGRRAVAVAGDFLTIELSEGSFDLALLNNNLYYFPPERRPALFERLAEHLAPGGVLAIQTPAIVESASARAAGLGEFPAVFDLFLRSHSNLYGLPDREQTREQLSAAGFGPAGESPILPGGGSVYLWARAGSA